MIDVGDLKLHCRISGEGQPCILLHGSFVDGSFWKEQVTTLSQEFRVIVPDLRGHGLSDKPISKYTPEVMARDIMYLMKKLGLDRASLVGHSMGVRIVLQFALDYPRLVDKVVLASGAAGPIENREDIFPSHVKKIIGIGTPHFDLKKFNYYEVWYSFADPSPAKVGGILKQIAQTPTHVKSSIGRYFPKTDFRTRLSQIQVPTLVIVGEKDVICPIEEAAYMTRHLPIARLEIVPDSGHCLPLEQPNIFNEKIVTFLKDG